jgi:AmmeMemoRadiSam system protein B
MLAPVDGNAAALSAAPGVDLGSAVDTLGPNVAGLWYPAEPERLAAEVDELLDQADRAPRPALEPNALIAPHAGYVYSGRVAASAFALVRRAAWRRVVLVGPSHYAAFAGAVVPPHAAWSTPLGRVSLERDLATDLARGGRVRVDARPFDREHALEAELPFLQRALQPGFRVLPLLVGQEPHAREVAAALAPHLDDDTLLVVSSDMTHHGRRFDYAPFAERRAERIRALDLGAVALIAAGDGAGFAAYCRETGATICGRRAIDVLLALGPVRGELVSYDSSGRQTGDWETSVSYAAVALRRSPA